MYSHEIARSLKAAATSNPMADALVTAGLVGGLHYGVRASQKALKPYATYTGSETDREENSSGVALVTYVADLTIRGKQKQEVAGAIINIFHRYWGRLGNLTTLNPDLARLVLIHPTGPGGTEIGEAEDLDLGVDVMLGVTSLTIRLSEHQPEILED